MQKCTDPPPTHTHIHTRAHQNRAIDAGINAMLDVVMDDSDHEEAVEEHGEWVACPGPELSRGRWEPAQQHAWAALWL